MLIKTNYELQSPAVITQVENFIIIEMPTDNNTDEIDDSDISTVSIYSFPRTSVFNYLIAKVNPFSDLYKLSENSNTSRNYILAQGNLHKNLSITKAIISGYKAAGYDVVTYYRGYIITTIANNCLSDLKIGDIITSINGVELSDEKGIKDVLNQLKEEGATTFNARILRDEKEQFVILKYDENGSFAFGGESSYTFPTIKNGPKFKVDKADSLGPSGGLMQTLYVYEQLTGCKLTSDIKVAGTGTVDAFGNAGLIGGIKQKIYIANAFDVDVFFVPIDLSYENEEDQYRNWYQAQEAVELLKKFGQNDMKVVPVKNIEEVISYLEGLQ